MRLSARFYATVTVRLLIPILLLLFLPSPCRSSSPAPLEPPPPTALPPLLPTPSLPRGDSSLLGPEPEFAADAYDFANLVQICYEMCAGVAFLHSLRNIWAPDVAGVRDGIRVYVGVCRV